MKPRLLFRNIDGGGGDPPKDPPKDPPRREQTVPMDRFDEVRRQAREAAARVKELEPQLAELATSKTKIAELERQIANATEAAALARAGVTDDDHVEALRMAWGKVAEADRPKTLADYAKAVGEMKPEDRPRLLAGFYAAAVSEPATQAKTAPRFPAQRASEPPANTDALLRELRAAREAVQADPSVANRKRLAEARAKLPG